MRGAGRYIAAAACALGAGLALAAPAEAKVTATVVDRVLDLRGSDGKDRVRVTCESGNAKVNGSNPAGGAVACSAIFEVDATMGGGRDVIDFSGITSEFGEAKFPGFGVGTGTAAIGGRGNDRYIPSRVAFNVFFGEEGNDRARGGGARDVLTGGPGDDTFDGADGRDSVLGDAGDDRLSGGSGSDLVSGIAGDDALFGGAGSDVLGGGTGRDKLRGGPGGDRLVGGADKDDLNGGPGKDTEIEKDPKN
jgi:Ca2+-binding RTX toxin-like protein